MRVFIVDEGKLCLDGVPDDGDNSGENHDDY